MDNYINMRIKIPHFLHAQLLRKQEERRQHELEALTLPDVVNTMLMEALLHEHWQRRAEEEEETERTK